MRVQFDLRPASLLERERKKSSFNVVRLLVTLLFLLFVAANVSVIALLTWNSLNLQTEIEDKEDSIAALEASKQTLEAEIARLKVREKEFVDTLKIMQDELPTLEVLNALEEHMEDGMAVNSLQFAPPRAPVTDNTVTLNASSPTEEQIVKLTSGLTGSGVFSGVMLPRTTLDEKTGRVSFTLDLQVRPIGQITSGVR